MSSFSSWFASPPPDAAVEIGPERIAAASIATRGGRQVVSGYASYSLPPGVVVASLTSPNILDRRLVVETLREAVASVGGRPRRVALVIPDAAAKISLLKFDQVPPRRDDLDQLVRWQVRKTAPFPIEDASVTYTAGSRVGAGREFIVELARRDIIRDYETVCGNAGVYAGLVDTATLSLVNLYMASPEPPQGDWLLVHLRPTYTSLAIIRSGKLIFFRNRPEDEDGGSLTDVVHQTAMYYQDRLGGQGFTRVLLGGHSTTPGEEEDARRSLQERLGVRVEGIDPTHVVPLSDRLNVLTDADVLAPLVGILLRTEREAKTA